MLRLLLSVSIGVAVASGAAALLHHHGHGPFAAKQYAPASGSYVEARTASVFAGACHYNGELVTAGREALLAWHFDGGTVDGLDLAGLDAVAVVRADENLKLATERSSIVYVSASLDERERDSLRSVLVRHARGALGDVREVRAAEVEVDVDGERYSVRVDGVAELTGSLDADRACCHMPQNVWYEPFAAVSDRIVGKSDSFSIHDAAFGPSFTRHDANDTFVASFSGVSTCCDTAREPCCAPKPKCCPDAAARADVAP